MTSIKTYNFKLPIEIRGVINLFTNNECTLVKKDFQHSYSQKQNCHYNVQSFVDENGGDIIFGWQLQRKLKLIRAGIWLWSFHSVWQKNNNEYYDLTEDVISRKQYSTFIADSNRFFDYKNGQTYNDIVILEKNYDRKLFEPKCDFKIEAGKIYWTLNDFSRIKEVNDTNYEDGICRIITSEYPKNIKLLFDKYQIKPEDGLIKKLYQAKLDSNILFDFNM